MNKIVSSGDMQQKNESKIKAMILKQSELILTIP